MKDRSRLITWDAALIVGYALTFALPIPDTNRIIIGFISAIILSNCIRNHIAVYKLTGKIY
jgi:tetrahydromethanopterin S-methyltransferase subunit F